MLKLLDKKIFTMFISASYFPSRDMGSVSVRVFSTIKTIL